MSIKDYSGIEGFCVQVESAQDVYDALDRMHTQLLDLIEPEEEFMERAQFIKLKTIKSRTERLQTAQRILEKAMEELLDLDGVRG